MKLSKENRAALRAHVEKVVAFMATKNYTPAMYREAIVRQGKSKDIALRVRWDFLWMLNGLLVYSSFPAGTRDAHVDTALRSVGKELGIPEFSAPLTDDEKSYYGVTKEVTP